MRIRSIALAGLLFLAPATMAQVVLSEPFLGVKLYSITQTSPRPNNIQLLEIDLNQPGLSFRNSPRDPGLPNGDETITQTTRQYADEQSAQVAVNTTFFRLENSGEARPTNNIGILVSDGDKISPWDATGEVGINITAENAAGFIRAPSLANRPTGFETTPPVPIYNAVRGGDWLLDNGNNVAPANSTTPGDFLHLQPRTAMGFNAVTEKLYLATIDGRQGGFSEGMYLREVADLLDSYGATYAINLDGGGSTTMAMDYYGDGTTRSQLVNRPVGRGTPGSERFNGASLGVFAPRNPNYVPPTGVVNVPPPDGTVNMIADFEDGEGVFFNDPDFSGSNRGTLEITDGNGPSRAERDANVHGQAYASQRVEIVSQDDPTWDGFRVRHLSGQGSPANNEQLGTSGYVGFYARTLTTGVTAAIALDENLGSAVEMGMPFELIADGEWHLYQWNLADAAQWDAFTTGGNGTINGPVMTVDSIIIQSLTDQDATLWFDAVAWNPNGVVPEPSGALALLLMPALWARSRPHRRDLLTNVAGGRSGD